MTKKRYTLTVLFLIGASCGFGAVPVTVEVVEVNKIWDKAPHNAFTDLVRWRDPALRETNDGFYCAFREGRGHVSTDGKIRILESKDANRWDSTALVALVGYDLRDAHLSVTPDGRLMLLGGTAPRKQDNQSAPTGTFVSFSQDGKQWTEPQIVVQPGRWLWCVTWNKAKAYGVSYTAGKGARYLDLLVSTDGINYKQHVAKLFEQGYPTEVTLRFDTDGICYALVRRDRYGTEPSSALLGVSRPDYKQWQWKDLGADFNGFGGPNLIRIPGGHWIAAGRMHQGGAHTALTYIDVENGAMTKLIKLPSGGDTSYPGLLWHRKMLYVSYYSSHEGKAGIYLAKVRVKPNAAAQEETFGAEPNPTGDPIGGGKGYQRLVDHSDYHVGNLEELLAALKTANAGQVVYIDDKTEMDLTGRQKIAIPAGVTVASGRGNGNFRGALLYSNELATSPLFLVGGENVRITGLRLRGPDQQRRTEQMRKLHKEGRYYSIANSDGIISAHPHLQVDNCELWGWSHAAVFLKRGALKAHVHHNYIHHNQRSGLGYGVCLDRADALIEANLFDWCRHHIAGTGRPGTSYEARYNLVLTNANGHSFDMHGGADRKDGTDIAGDSIKIHHNTFRATGVRAIVIRGRPAQSAEIHHNWFLHSDPQKTIVQTNATGNMDVGPNQFTTARTPAGGGERASVIAPGANVEKLVGGFKFTEGPAADAKGNIFFSDIPNNRIHKWSLDSTLSTFRENSGGSNGLYFDKKGNLLACEGTGRRLVSIDQQGKVTVLADKYQNKRFNSLNDLWLDPKGGIYFTDPRYGRRDNLEQDGEHVYYLSANRKKIIRVIDDMVRPNGIIGTTNGKKLYVTDHGGKKTFVYTINKDGTLSNKKLFAPEGSDGMTIDNEGNVYLTTRAVAVYNKKGEKIETIKVPEGPANVCFGGKDKRTLFITARTSLYAVRMRVKGL